jgi:bacterioferritin
MRGNDKVLEHLGIALRAELTAINQYFLSAKMNENWGYFRLAQHYRKESIEEMVHAERLLERILFLEGFPNMWI